MGAPGVETEENDGGPARVATKRALGPGPGPSSADVAQVADTAEQALAAAEQAAAAVASKVDQETFDEALSSVASNTDLDAVETAVAGKAETARQVFNVLDFIPSNVSLAGVFAGTTDITTYVQAAHDAAAAAGGGDVWFNRPGRYLIDTVYTASGVVYSVVMSGDHVRFCFVNGAIITTTKDTTPFTMTGYAKPGGFANWRNFWLGDPAKATYRPVANVAAGDMQLTCTTPAHAGDFAKGDYIYLRTGQCNDPGTSGGGAGYEITEPQAELVKVAAAGNTTTGVVPLQWATVHAYQQEWFVTGSTGKTSTDNGGGTRTAAVFGAAKVTDRILVDTGLINYQLDAPAARYGMTVFGVDGWTVPNARGRLGGSPMNAIEWRNGSGDMDFVIDAATAGSPRWIVTGATGCTLGRFGTIRARAINTRAVIAHFHEGCDDIVIGELDIDTVAGNDSANLTPLSIRARSSVTVNKTRIVSQGTGSPVFVDSTCTKGGELRNTYAKCATVNRGISIQAPNWRLVNTNPVTTVRQTGTAREPAVPIAAPVWLTGILRHDSPSITLGVLPMNAVVLWQQIALTVDVAFSDTGTDRVTVGWDSTPNAVVISAAALDLGTVGRKDLTTSTIGSFAGTRNAADRTLKAFFTGQNGDATAGKATIAVPYIIVPELT